MWVYIESESGLWTVGFYSPDNEWHPESDHSNREEAAQRVAYLNGLNTSVEEKIDKLNSRLDYLMINPGRKLKS